MRRINRTGRGLGASLLLVASTLALAGAARAQDLPEDGAAQDEGGEIVVTGYRASLESALREKRDATGVVDVIKADDIADFPDNNLAESLQRVPGVSITRDQGEGRNITVRGLGPVFTRVRINGIEGLSTTGGADASGGANRGRAFDFNVFASELFNSITVRKTASADIEEGSLGATVDLQTARPFDSRDDLVLAGTAQAGYNDFSKQWDPKVSGLFAATLADGMFGILVSAAYSERGIREEGPSTVRWERGTDNGGFAPASATPTGAQQGMAFFHPRIPRYDSYLYSTKRLGLTGSLQFKPGPSTLVTLDALYANFKSERSEQYLEALSFSRSGTGKPQTVIRPGATVDSTNSLVKGTFDNVDVRVESRFDQLETDFEQYTLSLHQDLGGSLRFDGLGGISKSKFANPIQTTVTLDANNVTGYTYDFTSGRNPAFGYGNLDVTNPSSFTLSEIRIRPQVVNNDFKVLRGQFEVDVTAGLRLRLGGDYKKYSFESQELRRASETVVPTLAPGQLATLSTLYAFSGKTDLNGTPGSFVVPNLDAFASALGIYSNTGSFALTGITNNSAQGNWTTVDERDKAAFLQAAFDTDLGGVQAKGDLGIRYVETQQRSTGYTGGGASPQLVTAGKTYDDWLPSANFAFTIAEDFVVRAGIAKVMARPNLGSLTPGGAFSISGGNRTYSRGNPDIGPTRAWDYDLSLEWYFAPESALVLAGFYKDIGSFVATTAQQIPFNQLGLPAALLTGTTVQPTDVFTVTQPTNSNGGTVKGFEVGIQAPFRFLPGMLSNFGIQANYTYVKSDIEYPLATTAGAPIVVRPLVNLSKHSANGTLYYEDDAFSIRGSLSYRSGYLTTVPGRNGVSPGAGPAFNTNAGAPTFNDIEGTHGGTNLDMSASYKLTDNVSITFEAINLTDAYVDQYIDSAADRLSVYHHTGRQFYLGGRFKF